ncbi:MAG: hypothetical protein AAF602_25820, partial [Myxococcota bacterium]
PLHDPASRCLIDDTPSGWQVLGHAFNTDRHAYFAPRGMLHLQWWFPARRVSVVTPSRLTEGRFEVWDGVNVRRICCHRHLTTIFVEQLALVPPCDEAMRHYRACFVHVWEIGSSERARPPSFLTW